MNETIKASKPEVIGGVKVEIVTNSCHDLVRGRGSIGEQVDKIFSEYVEPGERLRTITINIDEERI